VIETAPQLTKWPILDIEPLDTWSKGRLVPLGDACHAMMPYMASGAAMAMEDAAVLARCLVQADDHAGRFCALSNVAHVTRRQGATDLRRKQFPAPSDRPYLGLWL
jgi:2-polyprenyl-6-methoxyphenol hydroxylase-like FAD-dependent oxidoreductase